MQIVNVNGLEIEFSNGTLTINGLEPRNRKGTFISSSSKKDTVVTKDKEIDGDVEGNLIIRGNNVTVIVKGDVEGNVIGSCDITVHGDIEGNIVGGSILRK